MKPIIIQPSLRKHLCDILIGVCLLIFQAASTEAQSVFQASLGAHSPGDTATLSMGRFYFRVENNKVDFMALVTPFGPATSSLTPAFVIPGDTFSFSLGTSVRTEFRGSHTYLDNNPFLPQPPWVPYGYDDA